MLDLLPWADNHTTGAVGGPALLRAQLIAGPRAVRGFEGAHCAAGITVQPHGATELLWHNRAWEGFRAGLLIDPSRKRAVAVTCNTDLAMNGHTLGLRVLDTWFGLG